MSDEPGRIYDAVSDSRLFCKLPIEIRYRIYHEALDDCQIWKECGGHGLIRTCKAIYAETRHILLGSHFCHLSYKNITCPEKAKRWLTNQSVVDQIQCVKIELSRFKKELYFLEDNDNILRKFKGKGLQREVCIVYGAEPVLDVGWGGGPFGPSMNEMRMPKNVSRSLRLLTDFDIVCFKFLWYIDDEEGRIPLDDEYIKEYAPWITRTARTLGPMVERYFEAWPIHVPDRTEWYFEPRRYQARKDRRMLRFMEEGLRLLFGEEEEI